MNNLYYIFLAVAPVAVLVIFILLSDRYDKEPLFLLIKVFLIGMFISIPILIIELVLSKFNLIGGIVGVAIHAFVFVGFTEEFFKRLVVVKSVLYNKEFNEKLDGIVYCVIASLGFALVENVMYVFQFSAVVPNVWLTRAILSVPAHMLLGIIMGYFLGLSKFSENQVAAKRNYRMSLIVPAVLHGLYNFVLMAGIPNYIFYFAPIVVFMWVIGVIMLRRHYKASKSEHNHLHFKE